LACVLAGIYQSQTWDEDQQKQQSCKAYSQAHDHARFTVLK